MSGIEREVDSLGRVVIPMELRKKLAIESNSRVMVSLQDGMIVISPVEKHCALCGEKIGKKHKFRLCDRCIERIKLDD